MGEGPGGQSPALGQGEASGAHGCNGRLIALGAGDHSDTGMVLGGSSHHGGPADVDLLDAGVEGGARGDSVGEGVEVDHHQVDRGDIQFGQPAHVGCLATVGEDTGVDGGVEGLDPPFEAFGESGDVLDSRHRQTRTRDRGGGGAGGQDLDAGLDEGGGQVGQTGLVVDGDQGSADGNPLRADQPLGGDVLGGDGGLGLLGHRRSWCDRSGDAQAGDVPCS